MKFFSFVWHKLGSIHLTVVLCLLLTADLTVGYICLNRRTFLFSPLNDIGLGPWIKTYGVSNLAHTLWFFILLILLALLCINTFICTTDRVVSLMAKRANFSRRRLIFKFAPHIMHYAMIVILVGYLCSYLFAQVLDTRTLIPGVPFALPGTNTRITLIQLDSVYYQTDRLPAFEKRVLRPRAKLLISDGEHRRSVVLGCMRPLRCKGYGIFLKDFEPKMKEGGMNRRERVDLIVRKDPGVGLYLAGLLLFTIGLVMYLTEWAIYRKPDNRKISLYIDTVNNELQPVNYEPRTVNREP